MRNGKTVVKWMTGAALAGAFVLAAPHKAEAQVQFGVSVGSYGAPVYAAPAYGYADPYAYQQQRWIDHEQRERWEAERAAEWRHEQWQREHAWHEDRGWHGDRGGYGFHGDRY